MTLTSPSQSLTVKIVVPDVQQAAGLTDLIRRSPPLDANSDYCYLLLCTHYRQTCAVAIDAQDRVVGGVTGYMRPDRPDVLFIWQLVVDEVARGQGLAGRLLDALLDREACRKVRWIETSVNPSNQASTSVFTRLAERRQIPLVREPLFDADCFAGDHEAEILLRLGPFTA
jgi:L-2,4-diaminobutyric acid acetyltransferase